MKFFAMSVAATNFRPSDAVCLPVVVKSFVNPVSRLIRCCFYHPIRLSNGHFERVVVSSQPHTAGCEDIFHQILTKLGQDIRMTSLCPYVISYHGVLWNTHVWEIHEIAL